MSILGLIKDVALLPVDIALDLTGITPISRAFRYDEGNHETPFGTIDRLQSLSKNLDETKD